MEFHRIQGPAYEFTVNHLWPFAQACLYGFVYVQWCWHIHDPNIYYVWTSEPALCVFDGLLLIKVGNSKIWLGWSTERRRRECWETTMSFDRICDWSMGCCANCKYSYARPYTFLFSGFFFFFSGFLTSPRSSPWTNPVFRGWLCGAPYQAHLWGWRTHSQGALYIRL